MDHDVGTGRRNAAVEGRWGGMLFPDPAPAEQGDDGPFEHWLAGMATHEFERVLSGLVAEPAGASSEPYAKADATSTAQTGAGKPHPDAGPKPADPDVVPSKKEGQNQ